MAKTIANEADAYHDVLVEVLVDAVEQLPHKSGANAVLVGLLAVHRRPLAEAVVARVSSRLVARLASPRVSSDPSFARSALRFFAALAAARVVSAADVVSALSNVVAAAADAPAEEAAAALHADFLVHAVLNALPAGLAEIREATPSKLHALLEHLEAYVPKSKPAAPLSPSSGDAEKSPALAELLAAFVDACRGAPDALATFGGLAGKSHETLLPTLGRAAQLPVAIEPADVRLDAPTPDAEQAVLGVLRRERVLSPRFRAPLPESRRAISGLPKAALHAFADLAIDVLVAFGDDPRACATLLAEIPCGAEGGGSGSEGCEHALCEALLGEAVALPLPMLRPVFYNAVSNHLCRLLPKGYSRALYEILTVTYRSAETLDREVALRLCRFAAYHINSFNLDWPYDKFCGTQQANGREPAGSMPENDARRIFATDLIGFVARLSYRDRVKKTLPEDMHVLLPPVPAPAPRYDDGTDAIAAGHPPPMPPHRQPGSTSTRPACLEDAALDLGDRLRSWKDKDADGRITAWAQDAADLGADDVLRVVANCALSRGRKSLTHETVLFDRCAPALKALVQDAVAAAAEEMDGDAEATTERLEIALCEEVGHFWQNSALRLARSMERLLALRLVSPKGMVAWCVAKSTEENAASSGGMLMEVLLIALDKAQARCGDARAEVADRMEQKRAAEEALAAADSASRESVTGKLEAIEHNLKDSDGYLSECLSDLEGALSRTVLGLVAAAGDADAIRNAGGRAVALDLVNAVARRFRYVEQETCAKVSALLSDADDSEAASLARAGLACE